MKVKAGVMNVEMDLRTPYIIGGSPLKSARNGNFLTGVKGGYLPFLRVDLTIYYLVRNRASERV